MAYFMDCFSNVSTSCSREAIASLGEVVGPLSDDDRAALKVWATILDQYGGDITDASDVYDGPLPIPRPLQKIAVRTTLVAYTSATIAEYEGKLATIVPPAVAARAAEVLKRFEPRFELHWREAGPALTQILTRLADGAAQPELRRLLESIAAFYDADLPASAAPTVQLIFQVGASNRGNLLGHVARIEVFKNTRSADGLGVIAHELSHYLLSRVSARTLAPFVERFVMADDRAAYAGYGLLNEALATAWAGLVSRLLAPEAFASDVARRHGLYDDDLIDTISKALLPELDDLMAKHVRLTDSAFFEAYMRAAHRAFATGVPPKALLRPSVVAYSPDHALALRVYRTLATTADWDAQPSLTPRTAGRFFDAHPSWTRVLMLKRDELSALAEVGSLLSAAQVSEILRVAKTSDTLAYAALPKGKPAVFVLVANSAADMIWLLHRLGDLPATKAGVLTF
jgi:hypothetical protein